MAGLEEVDCAVIGAGVVGLAVARALAQAGHETIILEARSAIGTGASSRNSEVIHAGMYYPTGSLKAQLCVEGNRRLREYAASHKIAHKIVGKLIVAHGAEEEKALEGILARGHANGVHELIEISADEAHKMEPEVRCTMALWSPNTGIVDTHGYMLALLGEAQEAGAMLALNAPAKAGAANGKGIEIEVGGDQPMHLHCQRVVNCGGLGAQSFAHAFEGVPADTVPRQWMCKGNYFMLTGRGPFQRLVYPVPGPASLGCHYTLDLAGQARFGPDVEWVEAENYDVNPKRAEQFYDEVRLFWPKLPDGTLRPGYSGIRAKLYGPGAPQADFRIDGPEKHGVEGLINLFGIESPGLTSSLAIGDRVTGMLQ